MNYGRLVLAAVAATIFDAVYGFLVYGQALAALEASPAPLADGGEPGGAVDIDISDRWSAAVTERRAADLLAAASRRLEEVSARERQVAQAEQRVARQLQVVRDALRDAQLHVRGAMPEAGTEAVPA